MAALGGHQDRGVAALVRAQRPCHDFLVVSVGVTGRPWGVGVGSVDHAHAGVESGVHGGLGAVRVGGWVDRQRHRSQSDHRHLDVADYALLHG